MTEWLAHADLLVIAVNTLALITVLFGLGSVVAYLYLRKVLGESAKRSRLLWNAMVRNRRVAFAGAVIAILGSYTLVRIVNPGLGLPMIPPPWTTIMIVLCIDLMLWGPIKEAWQIHKMRQEGMTPSGDDEEAMP